MTKEKIALVVLLATFGIAAFLLAAPEEIPLNREFEGSFHCNDDGVKCTWMVKEKEGIFFYRYTLKNTGKNPIRCGWGVIDRVVGSGEECPMDWTLKPGEAIAVVLRHKDKPVMVNGRLRFWEEFDGADKDFNDALSKAGIDFPKRKFWTTQAAGQPGAVPARMAKEKK